MAVNLQKGQKISLDKEAGSALTKVVMGLGWDVAKKKDNYKVKMAASNTVVTTVQVRVRATMSKLLSI